MEGKNKNVGKTQQKILLLLLGGVALGISGSPRRYFKILKTMREEWKEIDTSSGKRSIQLLYVRGFLREKKRRDGSVELVLSKSGKRLAEEYTLEEVVPLRRKIMWDNKWRVVIFDVPENRKQIRDALRYHLKRIGFVELQHSVWVFPFDCWEQVQHIVDFYYADRFVHFIVADAVSGDRKLRRHFKLARR